MNAASDTSASPLSDLTRILWQQRRHLERLQYLMHVQALILSSGDDSMLRHAVDDIQRLLATISEIETSRRELTAEIGISMGLDADASLEDLVNRAPEPYEQILAEHRDAFLVLVGDITTVSLGGREQLQRGLTLTRELTSFVMGDAGDGGYDRTGASVRGSAERGLIDRTL